MEAENISNWYKESFYDKIQRQFQQHRTITKTETQRTFLMENDENCNVKIKDFLVPS